MQGLIGGNGYAIVICFFQRPLLSLLRHPGVQLFYIGVSVVLYLEMSLDIDKLTLVFRLCCCEALEALGAGCTCRHHRKVSLREFSGKYSSSW